MNMAKRQERSSRGATMVEFGIIAVALFTLIFGIVEGGFAVRARSAVHNAVDDAARRGAVAGTSVDADYQILRQLVGRGADAADIEYVVIYSADSGSSPVPANCIDGLSTKDKCNVYTPDSVTGDFNLNPGAYFCPGGLGTQWCPEDRAGGDIRFIGVYVKAKYEPIINQIFFEFNFDVDANSLQAIETTGDLSDD